MPKGKTPRTAWKPGQSGNPEGGSESKALTAALRRRVHRPALDEQGNEIIETDPSSGKRRNVKQLDLIAEAFLRKALKGDMNAISEIYNRIDGKVPNVNVEIPVKPAEEMTHEELVAFIAGEHDEGATDPDSALSRAKPAGNA